MELEEYECPDFAQIYDNLGIKVKMYDIPEIAEYHRVAAVVDRGWIWGLFHWRAYRAARASLPALRLSWQRAFLNAVLDFVEPVNT